MRLRAYAKVNLTLEVVRRRADGLHELKGLFQSIDLADEIEIVDAEDDELVVRGGAPTVPEENLAWRALEAARALTGDRRPRRLVLEKRIPTQAGLGGGSADAGAVLGALAAGVPAERLTAAATELGADVPFALVGGTAAVRGIGEIVDPLPFAAGYALAVVVPPVELATAAVYRRWDELDAPTGPTVPSRALPPSLRDLAPLRNDLYPPAVALAPELDDWRAELAARWDVPVAMTGSGSGLFAFFPTRAEAADAAASVPPGARFAEPAEPVPRGWEQVTAPNAAR